MQVEFIVFLKEINELVEQLCLFVVISFRDFDKDHELAVEA